MNLAQAINIPGYGNINGPLPSSGPTAGKFTNFNSLVTNSLDLVFALVGILTFVFLLMGIIQYILAGGEKEKLGKAKSRIIAAIIGFFLVAISFAASQFIEQILQPNEGKEKTPISIQITSPVYAQNVTKDLASTYDFGYLNNFGQFINMLLPLVYFVATTAVVFYTIFGAIKFLISAGDKTAVSAARDMITHGVIGLVLLIMLFLVLQFTNQFFGFRFSFFDFVNPPSQNFDNSDAVCGAQPLLPQCQR
ncbi:MAG: hypothetical protein Q7S88_01975 [Candidatus Daviesbacteria bacterium]|nr:hypothetical protein [Candidatus Daviesbacteria bacterium]